MKEKFKLGIYNIGIIRKDVEKILAGEDYKITWMKHNYKDRFFADPFLLSEDDEYYHILAEEFCFFENIGKISLLHVRKDTFRLEDKEILIQEPYHLSFPYCDGEWIYPEAYRSNAYYKYQVQNVKNKQKICETGLIDPIPIAIGKQEWLLTMTADKPLENLYLFTKNEEGMYEKCYDEAIKRDITSSRPAGHPFERNGIVYRPVQDSEGMYGRRTHLMRIDNISRNEIKEERVVSIDSDKFPPYNQGLHTFNAYQNYVIVDGYCDKYCYIRKSLYIKLPNLVKKIKLISGKY